MYNLLAIRRYVVTNRYKNKFVQLIKWLSKLVVESPITYVENCKDDREYKKRTGV